METPHPLKALLGPGGLPLIRDEGSLLEHEAGFCGLIFCQRFFDFAEGLGDPQGTPDHRAQICSLEMRDWERGEEEQVEARPWVQNLQRGCFPS